jgi:hypothetical protein
LGVANAGQSTHCGPKSRLTGNCIAGIFNKIKKKGSFIRTISRMSTQHFTVKNPVTVTQKTDEDASRESARPGNITDNCETNNQK